MSVVYQWRSRLSFFCPACQDDHQITVAEEAPGGVKWEWNGSRESPTISPSILQYAVPEIGVKRCHSFIREGKIEYCSDCEHSLAGQTVDLPEFPSTLIERYKP